MSTLSSAQFFCYRKRLRLRGQKLFALSYHRVQFNGRVDKDAQTYQLRCALSEMISYISYNEQYY